MLGNCPKTCSVSIKAEENTASIAVYPATFLLEVSTKAKRYIPVIKRMIAIIATVNKPNLSPPI
jgi:hypothetical protein